MKLRTYKIEWRNRYGDDRLSVVVESSQKRAGDAFLASKPPEMEDDGFLSCQAIPLRRGFVDIVC